MKQRPYGTLLGLFLLYPFYAFSFELCLTEEERVKSHIHLLLAEGQLQKLETQCRVGAHPVFEQHLAFRLELAWCRGEIALRKGYLAESKAIFSSIIGQAKPYSSFVFREIAALSTYRIAEMEESSFLSHLARFSAEIGHSDAIEAEQKRLFQMLHVVEDAYADVLSFRHRIWSERALFRFVSLLEQTLLHIRNQKNPFYLNYHGLNPFALPTDSVVAPCCQGFSLVSEMVGIAMLKLQSRLQHFGYDPELLFEIAHWNHQTLFELYAFAPPWKHQLQAGLIRYTERGFFQLSAQQWLPIEQTSAKAQAKRFLTKPPKPIHFAYAIASLALAHHPIPRATLDKALQHQEMIVRLSAYEAIRIQKEGTYLNQLIALLKQRMQTPKSTPLFASMNEALYGERERILFAIRALLENPSQSSLFWELDWIPVEIRAFFLASLKKRALMPIYQEMAKSKLPAVAMQGRYVLNQVAPKAAPKKQAVKRRRYPIVFGEP